MRYCGIDVSARPGAQQLVTLHERRTRGDEPVELVATFYAPGSVEAVARTVLGFGREAVVCVDAPGGRRLDLLADPAPRDGARAARPGATPSTGSATRCSSAGACRSTRSRAPRRVRGSAGSSGSTSASGSTRRSRASGRTGPTTANALEGPVRAGSLGFGRVAESYPDAVFAALLGHRAPPKRTPWGLQQRIAALRLRGVVDADGGLWHRTLDELDACALAYAAHALADGTGWWAGDAREGVVVLPVAPLLDRYAPLPPPARQALA